MRHHQKLFSAAIVIIGAGLAGTSAAMAGATGGWVEGPHTKARLIAASWTGKAHAEIAIEIKLDKGWKTYWRNPGDAGVPPRLDWKRSHNLKSSTASWPVPKRLPDPYGESIGYKGDVVIPVRMSAVTPGKPVQIRLDMEYGVCAEVCIPVTASLALDLAPGLTDETHNRRITAWKARTPSTAPQSNGLDLTSVTPLKDGKTGLLVTITGRGGLKAPDLLVEGPSSFYFTIPELVSQTADKAAFKIEIDGVKSLDELKGHNMTLTLIDKTRARQMEWPLGKL